MKKTLVTAAVLGFLSSAAFAASHSAHTTAADQRHANAHASASAAAKPGRIVQTDTTTNYDVSTTDKKGTESYGGMKQTRTTAAHGTQVLHASTYHHYTPSDMANSNDMKGELSFGLGGTYSFAKDTYGDRLSNTGLAGTVQLLWRTSPHLAVGVDYAALAPQHRRSSSGGDYGYKNLRAHNLTLAGKLTLNPWHRMQVYMPMGIGASHISLKGSGTREGITSSDNDHKLALGMFAGLGLQYNLTDTLFMGLEYRYNFAFAKADDLNRYGKDRYMDFHSAFLRMGMRF